MNNKKNKNIRFTYNSIVTEQFATFIDLYDSKQKNIKLNINYTFGVDSEKNGLMIETGVRFKQNESIILILTTSNHFNIKEEGWNHIAVNENNAIRLNKEFIQHLLLLSISSLRGVLHAKTEKTLLSALSLPVVDISSMIVGDIVINMNKE